MKKKFTTTAYLKDAENYTATIYNLEDFYLVIKKINKVKSPWISEVGITVMDNGYFILECTPKNELYSMRVFYNQNKKPILYYFDITNENGIDENTYSPYYVDIYTDIMIYTKDNNIVIVDEDELKEAFAKNEITKEEYTTANKTTKKLFKELKNNSNKYKNIDFSNYLI